MTGRVHDMILDPKLTGQLPEVVAEGGYYGMQTFDQHLLKPPAGRPDHDGGGDARRDLAARLQADGRRPTARAGTTMDDVAATAHGAPRSAAASRRSARRRASLASLQLVKYG